MTFAPQVVNSSDKEGGKVLRNQEVPNTLSLRTQASHHHLSQQMVHQPNKHNDGLVNHIMT